MIAAAGDIACDPEGASFNNGDGEPTRCRQRYTSDLLVGDSDLDAVLALGDTQYEEGTLEQHLGSYDPSWGRVKSITRPVIGNHDYRDPAGPGAGYWDYFNGVGVATGPAGDRGKGWYSFDVGGWHLIALNSMCDQITGGCGPGSEQEQWLRADLAANADAACTLAYLHHPLFNSGPEGSYADTPWNTTALWQALYDAGADLVLTAHSHAYERFAPQNPQGNADARFGLREFIVGTGGQSLGNNGPTQPNSELRDNTQFGVIKLALHPNSYDWSFVRDDGQVTDSGSGACHGPPDFTPPETSIGSAPQGVITQREASFSFDSSEPGSSFRCRLDGPGSTAGSEHACASPQSYSGLANGDYTFSVHAVDAAGNADSTPATQPFTVDATAPDTSIGSGPTGATTARRARFAFSSPEANARFECRLDSGSWAACTSPAAYTRLPRRRHTFEVRALDPFGNADASPASRRWSVERPSRYRPRSYKLLSGQVHRNRGRVRRLRKNDQNRLEIAAAAKRSGRFVSAFRTSVSIARDELATLRRITLDYNGGSTARGAEIKIKVFKFRTRRWRSPWSPSASGRDYVSSRGIVRIRVTGKGAEPFRTRTDLLGVTVEY